MKKMHPADVAHREKVATATHFNVHLRRNPGDVFNQEAATLAEAIKIAEATPPTPAGKKPMVYAVTPDKQSIFVTADMIEAAKKSTPAVGAALSGTEISKLTAIITGGGFKRANSKEAAIKRFQNALADKVGEPMAATYQADIIGAADFQTAKDWLATAMEKASAEQDHYTAEEAAETEAEKRAKITKAANKMTKDQVADAVLAELRKPNRKAAVEVAAKAAPTTEAKPAKAEEDRPDYRDPAKVNAIIIDLLRSVGPAKVGAFRSEWIKRDPDGYAHLAPTQQKGIMRKALNRLVEAGKATRDGSTFAAA